MSGGCNQVKVKAKVRVKSSLRLRIRTSAPFDHLPRDEVDQGRQEVDSRDCVGPNAE